MPIKLRNSPFGGAVAVEAEAAAEAPPGAVASAVPHGAVRRTNRTPSQTSDGLIPRDLKSLEGLIWDGQVSKLFTHPVGGRLRHFKTFWGQTTTDAWVLEVVEKGYPFPSSPALHYQIQWKHHGRGTQ